MASSRSLGQRLGDLMAKIQPGVIFLVLIFCALIAFELFNYSTTDHALQDLLGNLEFGSLHWSTILAFAFCGIDFAGIARLFTPEQGMDEPKEVWYLFGAWLLAATMNAILTWWGVSMAIVNHPVQSASIVDPRMISTVVPVFVATMVWVIRILIIGTLSIAMDRSMHTGDQRGVRRSPYATSQPALTPRVAAPASAVQSTQSSLTPRPTLNRPHSNPEPRYARSGADFSRSAAQVSEVAARTTLEPTYHSLSAAARTQASQAGLGERGAQPVQRT